MWRRESEGVKRLKELEGCTARTCARYSFRERLAAAPAACETSSEWQYTRLPLDGALQLEIPIRLSLGATRSGYPDLRIQLLRVRWGEPPVADGPPAFFPLPDSNLQPAHNAGDHGDAWQQLGSLRCSRRAPSAGVRASHLAGADDATATTTRAHGSGGQQRKRHRNAGGDHSPGGATIAGAVSRHLSTAGALVLFSVLHRDAAPALDAGVFTASALAAAGVVASMALGLAADRVAGSSSGGSSNSSSSNRVSGSGPCGQSRGGDGGGAGGGRRRGAAALQAVAAGVSGAAVPAWGFMRRLLLPATALNLLGGAWRALHGPSAALAAAVADLAAVGLCYSALTRQEDTGRIAPGRPRELAWRRAHKAAARRLARHLGDLPPSPPLAPALAVLGRCCIAAGLAVEGVPLCGVVDAFAVAAAAGAGASGAGAGAAGRVAGVGCVGGHAGQRQQRQQQQQQQQQQQLVLALSYRRRRRRCREAEAAEVKAAQSAAQAQPAPAAPAQPGRAGTVGPGAECSGTQAACPTAAPALMSRTMPPQPPGECAGGQKPPSHQNHHNHHNHHHHQQTTASSARRGLPKAGSASSLTAMAAATAAVSPPPPPAPSLIPGSAAASGPAARAAATALVSLVATPATVAAAAAATPGCSGSSIGSSCGARAGGRGAGSTAAISSAAETPLTAPSPASRSGFSTPSGGSTGNAAAATEPLRQQLTSNPPPATAAAAAAAVAAATTTTAPGANTHASTHTSTVHASPSGGGPGGGLVTWDVRSLSPAAAKALLAEEQRQAEALGLPLYGRADHAHTGSSSGSSLTGTGAAGASLPERLGLACRAVYLMAVFLPFLTLGVALLLLSVLIDRRYSQRLQQQRQQQLAAPGTAPEAAAVVAAEQAAAGSAAEAEAEAPPPPHRQHSTSAPLAIACRLLAWRLLLAGCRRSGAAFIKWGQWAATRVDLFPDDFCDTLSNLHDRAPTHSFAFTRKQVERSFGVPLESMFESFQRLPVASGSIAQIHRAVMRGSDGSRLDVAVKVVHPRVALRIRQDFALLRPAAAALGSLRSLRSLSLPETVSQFSATMTAQADLRVEAAHLRRFYANFAAVAAHVTTPRPLPGLVRPEVMVETWESGRSVSYYIRHPHPSLNGRVVCLGLDTYLKMLLQDNFVHTDLHPGNIMVRAVDGEGRPVERPGGPLLHPAATTARTNVTCAGTRAAPGRTDSGGGSSGSTLYSDEQQQQQQQRRREGAAGAGLGDGGGGRGQRGAQQPHGVGGGGQSGAEETGVASGEAGRPRRRWWRWMGWRWWRRGGRLLHGTLSLAQAVYAAVTGGGRGRGRGRGVRALSASAATGHAFPAAVAANANAASHGGAGGGAASSPSPAPEPEAGVQLVLLDFGLAEELSPAVRHHFISFLQHLLRGDGVAAAGHLLRWTARRQACPDPAALTADMVRLAATQCDLGSPQGIDLDKVMKDVLRLARRHGVTIDSCYAALVIAVCVIVGFATSLDPGVNLADPAVPAMLAHALTGRVVGRLYNS